MEAQAPDAMPADEEGMYTKRADLILINAQNHRYAVDVAVVHVPLDQVARREAKRIEDTKFHQYGVTRQRRNALAGEVVLPIVLALPAGFTEVGLSFLWNMAAVWRDKQASAALQRAVRESQVRVYESAGQVAWRR